MGSRVDRSPQLIWFLAYCLQSVNDMPIVQDVPPPGGFPSIRIYRRLPSTGPTGVTIFAVGGAVMAYGYYRVRWQYTNCYLTEASIKLILRFTLQVYQTIQKRKYV
jgi:hypothetical protein